MSYKEKIQTFALFALNENDILPLILKILSNK